MTARQLMRTEFAIFCCIGVANTAIHASIVLGLVELAGVGSTLANAAAFFISNLFSYFCNARFTFKSDLSPQQYLRFLSSSLTVLATTVIIAGLGELLEIHYMIATLCLIAVSPIISFLVVKRFAFGKRA